MTTVWVVQEDYGDGPMTQEIFATEGLAQAFIKNNRFCSIVEWDVRTELPPDPDPVEHPKSDLYDLSLLPARTPDLDFSYLSRKPMPTTGKTITFRRFDSLKEQTKE